MTLACSRRPPLLASSRPDTGSDEMKESLARIEAELADVKRQLGECPAPSAP